MFGGDGYMELRPLTDEQWSDVNIKLSVKPKAANGKKCFTPYSCGNSSWNLQNEFRETGDVWSGNAQMMHRDRYWTYIFGIHVQYELMLNSFEPVNHNELVLNNFQLLLILVHVAVWVCAACWHWSLTRKWFISRNSEAERTDRMHTDAGNETGKKKLPEGSDVQCTFGWNTVPVPTIFKIEQDAPKENHQSNNWIILSYAN